jgi:transaldolase
MKFFIDSANLHDIEEALKRGFVRGVTTNPSILAKEPKTAFKGHIQKIVDLIHQYQPDAHLSVEVFSRDTDEILRQAHDFIASFKHPQLSVKVQIGWDELEAIRKLSNEGISVNCTCCMTINQAAMAAAAGARYVSLFWGRIRDMGVVEEKLKDPTLSSEKRMTLVSHARLRQEYLERGVLEERHFDPAYVVRKTREIMDKLYPNTEIIAGSMRTASDVKNSGLAGAHIVTVPPKFFPDMISNFKTDEVVQDFLKDFEKWLS